MPQRHRTCRSKPTAKTLLSSDGQTGQTRSLISPTDDGGRDLPGTCCDPTPGTLRFYSCRRISGSKHVNKREKKKPVGKTRDQVVPRLQVAGGKGGVLQPGISLRLPTSSVEYSHRFEIAGNQRPRWAGRVSNSFFCSQGGRSHPRPTARIALRQQQPRRSHGERVRSRNQLQKFKRGKSGG
jgi:hypothetical protein